MGFIGCLSWFDVQVGNFLRRMHTARSDQAMSGRVGTCVTRNYMRYVVLRSNSENRNTSSKVQ